MAAAADTGTLCRMGPSGHLVPAPSSTLIVFLRGVSCAAPPAAARAVFLSARRPPIQRSDLLARALLWVATVLQLPARICELERPSPGSQLRSWASTRRTRSSLTFYTEGRLLRHPCRPGTLCKADDAAPSDMMPAQIAPRIPVTPHCACSLLRHPRLHHPGLSRHRGIEQPGLRNCPMCLVL